MPKYGVGCGGSGGWGWGGGRDVSHLILVLITCIWYFCILYRYFECMSFNMHMSTSVCGTLPAFLILIKVDKYEANAKQKSEFHNEGSGVTGLFPPLECLRNLSPLWRLVEPFLRDHCHERPLVFEGSYNPGRRSQNSMQMNLSPKTTCLETPYISTAGMSIHIMSYKYATVPVYWTQMDGHSFYLTTRAPRPIGLLLTNF